MLRLGAVAVMLNPLLSAKELAHQLADSGAKRLVVLDHFLPKLQEIRDRVDLTRTIITSLTDSLPWPLTWLYPFKARRDGLALGFAPAPDRYCLAGVAETSPSGPPRLCRNPRTWRSCNTPAAPPAPPRPPC